MHPQILQKRAVCCINTSHKLCGFAKAHIMQARPSCLPCPKVLGSLPESVSNFWSCAHHRYSNDLVLSDIVCFTDGALWKIVLRSSASLRFLSVTLHTSAACYQITSSRKREQQDLFVSAITELEAGGTVMIGVSLGIHCLFTGAGAEQNAIESDSSVQRCYCWGNHIRQRLQSEADKDISKFLDTQRMQPGSFSAPILVKRICQGYRQSDSSMTVITCS